MRTKLGRVVLMTAAIGLGLGAGLATAKERRETSALARDATSVADRYHRMVFYAVLEGLYEAGAENELVDRVLMADPVTSDAMHFVPGCPICLPAVAAFRVYRGRASLGLKGGDTYGPGLREDIVVALRSDDFKTRMEGVHAIIEGSVRERMDRLRLTESERAVWERGLAERRKKGMAMLSQLRGAGNAAAITATDRCAACDGANDGLERR